MAEWSARFGNNRRLIMNMQQTNEIRELNAAELDAVSGGITTESWTDSNLAAHYVAVFTGLVVGTLVSWITGLFD
jgi:hypothetical protein